MCNRRLPASASESNLSQGRVRAAVRRRRARRPARGFTLIETALTTVIVGVGVLALIESQQAFMRSNQWSTHAATATYLANEIREMTRQMPRHDPVTGLYFQESAGVRTLAGWGPEPGELGVGDFDDLDDFDGITFIATGTPGPADGTLPGPIDAFGSVIPEILADGSAMVDAQGRPVPMQGWSQRVRVEKVMPFNTAMAVPRNHEVISADPNFKGIPVDGFPLRVTVDVLFQGMFDTEPAVVATVVWIVP